MVSGGLWPPLDLQPMAFSAHPVFSWIHFGGKPDLGSEQPAPFGRLQSQGQSSHTKPRGLRGAQVTLMNEMNSFQSQVQNSSLVCPLKVGEERAAISC